MAEGPGPRIAPLPRGDEPTARGGGPRPEYESVDLEEVEAIEEVPPSSEEELSGIDIDIEEASEKSHVDKLLAMTGEVWSIDAQRETLKEAAKDKVDRPVTETPPALERAPAVHIPTPFDFGVTTDAPAISVEEESRPALPSVPPELS